MISFNFEEVEEFANQQDVLDWLYRCIEHLNQTVAQISYVFINDEQMIALNNETLQHNYATDIITFDNRDSDTEPIDADIFISLETVLSNSQTYNCPFATELKRVLIHGILHLSGFDDHSEEDIATMRAQEEFYLKM